MTESEIYHSLEELFSDVFLRDDIVLTSQTSARDVDGWDSFKQIEIIMAVEARFSIRFLTREIDGLKNVGDLVSVIARKVT